MSKVVDSGGLVVAEDDVVQSSVFFSSRRSPRREECIDAWTTRTPQAGGSKVDAIQVGRCSVEVT